MEDLRTYEKEKDMPYVTSAERIGRKEGRKEGKLELYIDLIQNMKKNNLSEQEIARLINLDIEIIRKVLNNEQVEIPVHLLVH
jgi:predicted transposase YdaD